MPNEGVEGNCEGGTGGTEMIGDMGDVVVANQIAFAVAGHIECCDTITEAGDTRCNPPPRPGTAGHTME